MYICIYTHTGPVHSGPRQAHTRPEHTLSSGQRCTSKLSESENRDHTPQRNNVLSGVKFPSDPQSPPHSNVSKHNPTKIIQLQARHPLGSQPRVPSHQPSPCREADRQAGERGDKEGQDQRQGHEGLVVGIPKPSLGQPCSGPSCLLQGPRYCPARPSATAQTHQVLPNQPAPRSTLRPRPCRSVSKISVTLLLAWGLSPWSRTPECSSDFGGTEKGVPEFIEKATIGHTDSKCYRKSTLRTTLRTSSLTY